MAVSRRFRYTLSLLIGVGLLFAVAKFINLAGALEQFDEYAWSRFPAVLILSLVYYLLKAVRWHFFLKVIDINLPLKRSLLVYLAGQWFAFSPAGEFVRAYLLIPYGFSFGRASAAVTVQVIFDFLSLGILASFSVFWYRELAYLILPFTVLLTLIVFVIAYGPLLTRGRRMPFASAHASGIGRRWLGFYHHTQHLLAWKSLAVGLALGLMAVTAGALVLHEVNQGYNIPSSVGQSAYIYTVSQLAGGLSMLPHGLGAVEASAIALYGYAGIDSAFAASAIVLFRLATVGWGMILGGISLLALRNSTAATPIAAPE